MDQLGAQCWKPKTTNQFWPDRQMSPMLGRTVHHQQAPTCPIPSTSAGHKAAVGADAFAEGDRHHIPAAPKKTGGKLVGVPQKLVIDLTEKLPVDADIRTLRHIRAMAHREWTETCKQCAGKKAPRCTRSGTHHFDSVEHEQRRHPVPRCRWCVESFRVGPRVAVPKLRVVLEVDLEPACAHCVSFKCCKPHVATQS